MLDTLAIIGAALLVDTVEHILAGTVQRQTQDESLVTMAPMLSKDISPIDWSWTARRIIDHIRGLQPWPVATTLIDNTLLKIFKAEYTELKSTAPAGTPLSVNKKGLEIVCGDGEVILITEVQAQGGKRMRAPDYFRGHPIKQLGE